MQQQTVEQQLFRLENPSDGPFKRALFNIASRPLTKLLRFDTLNSLYDRYRQEEVGGEFVDRVLEMFGIRIEMGGRPLSKVPAKGPLVVVANHPFGAIEGVILVKLLKQIRPDVKVMANYMLGKIPEMREHLFPVDPFGTERSAKANISGLKESLRWLRDGHLLAVFPAGEVSSLKVGRRMVADPQWSETVARMVRKTRSPVVPMFFNGRNSAVFQAAGMIHPRLRTVLLPHENLKKASRTVQVSLGGPIAFERLESFENDTDLTDYLRFRTYVLRRQKPLPFSSGKEKAPRNMAPLAGSMAKHILASEVAALPDENLLVQSGDLKVFQAEAWRIPRVLREIGVLREKTFRAVGEGTGNPTDIDEYDDTYRHLVLWNDKEREVCGAYRFALSDEILAAQGAKGIYSASLFRFSPGFLEELQPALELGRSFVRAKYQRSYQPLLMLWKGLAAFIVKNPRYSKLFGCVSISGDYSPLSRELMAGFLRRHCFDKELARMVTPSTPLKDKALKRLDVALSEAALSDPEDLGSLVTEVEGRGIPVLLKQYLKLGGKILGFNVDPDFGDCLDGLILVDLVHTDPKILARFMGTKGAERFLCHHEESTEVAPVAA